MYLERKGDRDVEIISQRKPFSRKVGVPLDGALAKWILQRKELISGYNLLPNLVESVEDNYYSYTTHKDTQTYSEMNSFHLLLI